MSGNTPQLQSSLAFRSRDAVDVDEARCAYTFEVTSANLRAKPIRLSLQSLEFPVTQYTVEDTFDRIYLSEGLHILPIGEGPPPQTLFVIERYVATPYGKEETSEFTETEIECTVPLFRNAARIVRVQDGIRVTTQYPHGLWLGGVTSVIDLLMENQMDALLVCDADGGCVSLTSSSLEYESENAFVVRSIAPTIRSEGDGMLCVGALPSPDTLAQFVQVTLNSVSRLSYQVEYDPLRNKVAFSVLRYPEGSNALMVETHGPLAQHLGLPSGKSFVFRRNRLVTSNLHSPYPQTSDSQNMFTQRLDPLAQNVDCEPPLSLPTEYLQTWWSYARLPEGWYMPISRPFCNGAPYRLPNEFDLAINRFYIPYNGEKPCMLVFRDPMGSMCSAIVLPGRYSGNELANAMDAEMNKSLSSEAKDVHTHVSVQYDEARGVYTYECEWKPHADEYVPAEFVLEFAHPNSIDPRRLGFEASSYGGCSFYESVHPFHVPLSNSQSRRDLSNIYQLNEKTMLKKMVIESSAQMVLAKFTAGASSTARLQTMFGNGQPCSSSLQQGDLVYMSRVRTENRTSREEKGANLDGQGDPPAHLQEKVGPHSFAQHATGPFVAVVMEKNAEKVTLFLPHDFSADVVRVWKRPEPFLFSFHPSLTNTVPAAYMGFEERSYGCLANAVPRSLTSVRLYNMEHPDYLKVFIGERTTKSSSTLTHISDTRVEQLLSKLVFFPQFRIGGLGADVMLPSGESISRFTLRFECPDGRPYHLHGSEFYFTLQLITTQSE